MASILRSSKFVRYIAGFARNVVLNTPREFDGNFVNTTQCLCGAAPRNLATQTSAQHDQNLERSLRRIDQDVRKSGRISRRDIEDVLEEIRSSRSATSSQSLMVIRCCGNLVPDELPEIRTKLVQEIWNTLNKLNVPMDISHYNALLRVYLENEHPFSPTEFLADLESKGIEPNRVTFQRLIARYCQVGDIEGATKILEFMREKQMPVNEIVFNALIVGHSQAGDMDSAHGILSVMTQAGLEPSADTYTTLLCGYATKGDLDTIKKIFAECEEKEIYLLDKDYLDIVYALALGGHEDKVNTILSKVRRSIGFNQDAINLIYRLINKGKDFAAYEVLKTMTRGTRTDGSLMQSGGFFVRQLVKANRPVEVIVDLCQRLEDEELFDRALSLATESSLQIGNDNLAFSLLEKLKSRGVEIRQHFFWPLFMSKAQSDPKNGVLSVLNKMTSLGIMPSQETMRDYVIPNLSGRSSDIIATLRENNISVGASASSLVISLLQRHEIEEAAVIARKITAYYSPELIKRPLTHAFVKTGDLDSYVTILRCVHENLDRINAIKNEDELAPSVDKTEVIGGFLLDLEKTNARFFQANIENILKELVNQGLSISTTTAEKIQDKLSEKMTDEVAVLLGRLTSGELTPTPLERKPPTYTPSHQMNIAQLERLIENLHAKNQETKGLKRQLFTLYFRAKELEKAEKLLQEMQQSDFVITSGIYAQMMDLYAYFDKLEPALEYYEKLKQAGGDKFTMDEAKVIRLAHLLLKNDKFDAALEILDNTPRERRSEDRTFSYSSLVWRFLNAIADTGNVEQLDKAFDKLVQKEFIEVNNVYLGPLIKVHLVNNDIDKALEKFEWCVNQFKATPWKNELACKLIQTEDAEKLQKLTDLSTTVHGEINSLYDLVFAFVECGRVRQARKILETPGLQNRPQRINFACERYQQEGLVKPLEGLKDATKDLNHIDRSDIYYQLLLSYIKQDDAEKALGLWTQMQEEDLAPPDNFLIKLGDYLTSRGIEPPFITPEKSKSVQPKQKSDDRNAVKLGQITTLPIEKSANNIFKSKLKDNDLDGALEVKKRTDEKLTVTDLSILIEKLVQSDRINEATKLALEILDRGNLPVNRIFRFLLNRLATNGDLESLTLIGSKINQDVKKIVSFDNRICHANLVAGKVEDYLNSLEKEIDSATEANLQAIGDKFPRGGAHGILERHPELVEKYETVAVKYAKRGILAPLNVLWTHFFITGKDAKADALWKQYLKDAPRIMFQRIVQTAREKQDENLTKKLIEHLKISNVTEGAIGNAYSCLLDVLVAKNLDDEAVKTFETAVKEVGIDTINRTAVLRVKGIYDKLGKEFNFKIPPKTVKNTQTSSSSSDSDHAVVKKS